MATQEQQVSPLKKREVRELVKLLKGSPVVAVARIDKIPASSIQQIRGSLRNDATIRVSKNTLITRALEEAGKDQNGLNGLASKVEGSTAIIATSLSPFRLYRKLEASKTKAPAKGGEKAPEDIWVRAGDTPFKPGPIVGELQKAGIPAKIDQGKVVIASDKLVVKAGDAIPVAIAQALTRLEIHPLTIGMDVRAVFEEGMIYDKSVLAVDEAQLMAQVVQAARNAVNLSVNAAFPTKKTIEVLLAKAHTEAMNLGVEAEILDKKVIDVLLARANAHGLVLAKSLRAEALDDELKQKIG